MKIYISHSRKFDFKKELYEPIKNSDLVSQHEFIFPHDESDAPYPTRELLQSGTVGMVIAEVSFPGTDQGIELGWADMLQIPIVCIYKEGADISSSLSIVTKKFLMYTDVENMISDLKGLLNE